VQTAVCLRISNVGAIAESMMATLFETFKRAAASGSVDNGLGLGLFIARELVRPLDGEITVAVAEGKAIFEEILQCDAALLASTKVASPQI